MSVNPEPRKVCYDSACQVRATCRRWTERNEPGYAVRSMTWRTLYYCHSLPCDHYQATEEPKP